MPDWAMYWVSYCAVIGGSVAIVWHGSALLIGAITQHMARRTGERIICAAIWVDDGLIHPHQPRNVPTGVVFAGWRHANCFTALNLAFPKGSPISEEERHGKHQGFLTSRGYFATRTEAALIATAAGQVKAGITSLTSEHLY